MTLKLPTKVKPDSNSTQAKINTHIQGFFHHVIFTDSTMGNCLQNIANSHEQFVLLCIKLKEEMLSY